MITRESVLSNAELVSKICNSRLLTSDMLDALQGLIEYVKQDPDPDAALWAEINEYLNVLSEGLNSGVAWKLVRSGPVGGHCKNQLPNWRIVTRDRGLYHWTSCKSHCWANLSEIRDQLRKLATERGLLTPSLEEIMLSLEEMGEDGRAQFSAFVAAQAAKAAKGGG